MSDGEAGLALSEGEAPEPRTGRAEVSRIDGRRLRSRRTRQRLVEAYLDLLSETGKLPGCNAVAARAGVSVRTLFERFRDMADLARAATDRAATAQDAAVPGTPAMLDRAARIRLHVVTRARQCEGAVEGDDLAGIAELETFYDRELSALDADQRRRLLIALGTLTDADGWQRIRRRFGTSISEACAVWETAIDRLLPLTPRR